jgi:AAA family ATP:ADP antiporter
MAQDRDDPAGPPRPPPPRRAPASRGELTRTIPIAVAYGLILASLYLLKPARNALFLNHLGIGQLPYVLLLVALVGGLAAGVYGRYARTVRIDRLIPRTFLILAGSLLAFRWLLETGWGWVFYGFYIWVTLYGLLTTSLVWLLANAVFTAREARRVFGFIGTGGIAGAILGGAFTRGAVEVIGTENLLLVCAGILVLCLPLLRRTPLAEPPARRKADVADDGGLQVILRSPLLRALAATAGLIAVVSVIVDIQFNELVDRAYPDQDAKTAFFGQFFAILSTLGFLFQLALTPVILRRLGVGVAVLILPVLTGLGSIAILIAPGLAAGILAKGADGTFRHSLHKSANEVLFLPVPAAHKSQAKLFLDTTVDTAASGLGAILVLLLTGPLGLGHDKLSFISVALVAAVVVVARRMRRAYVDAFRDALDRQKLDLEELRIGLAEAGALDALLPALRSENPRQLVYVLSLLGQVNAKELVEPVTALLTHPSPEVRRHALVVLQGQAAPPPQATLHALLTDLDPDVRLEAMTLLAHTLGRSAAEVLDEHLSASDPRVATAALGVVAREGPDLARVLLTPARVAHLLDTSEGPGRIEALAGALAGLSDPALSERFWSLANGADVSVARAAVEGLGRHRCVEAAEWLLPRLEDRALRGPARRALAQCGESAVGILARALSEPGCPIGVRRIIPRVLGQIPAQAAVDTLLMHVGVEDPQIRRPVIRALARLRAGYPELLFPRPLVLQAVLREAESYYNGLQISALLEAEPAADPTEALLVRAVRERQARTLEDIFHLMGLRYGPKDMATAYQGLISPRRDLRASAVEFLDNLLRRRIREVLIPILEPGPLPELQAHARALFGGALEDKAQALDHIARGRDPWLRTCVAATRRAGGADGAPTEYGEGGSGMLSVVEKVIFLQEVDVFSEVPTEQLAYLASIAEEREAAAGEALYQTDQPSDSMYLVLEGEVRLHRGDIQVTLAGDREAFGTWALFDDEPRLVSATCTRPTRLLRLDKDDFIEVLADNVQVTQGVLKAMVRRLRALGRTVAPPPSQG